MEFITILQAALVVANLWLAKINFADPNKPLWLGGLNSFAAGFVLSGML